MQYHKYVNSVTVAIYLFSWDINVEHMLVFLIVYDFHCLKLIVNRLCFQASIRASSYMCSSYFVASDYK